jgi:tetratricopeptide (TPR) repeat protein
MHLAQQNWENCIEQWDALGMAEGMAGATPAKTLVEEKTYRDAFLAVYHLMQLHLANLRVERGLEYLLRAESMVESAEQGAMLAAAVASAASKLLDDRDAVNALSCFEKCANYYEKLMEQDGQVHALRGVAKCHLAMGNLERALTACKMALAVRTDAYSLILLLRVYLLLGDADGAAATLNQLIQSPTSSLDSCVCFFCLLLPCFANRTDDAQMTKCNGQYNIGSDAYR